MANEDKINVLKLIFNIIIDPLCSCVIRVWSVLYQGYNAEQSVTGVTLGFCCTLYNTIKSSALSL